MTSIYKIIKPQTRKVPILISVPHCGTSFPRTLKPLFKKDLIKAQDDTDFYVHKLYDFVSEMGITMIHAHYNRWVIDLNRSPKNQALYNDGRLITGLCPSTNFLGEPLYKIPDYQPDTKEINRRKELYFQPYYEEVNNLLTELRSEFGQALLWDAHSIRQHVPTIQAEPFPDLILGNNDQTSAAPNLINVAINTLRNGPYPLNHNTPFKGGNITRHFGKPATGFHALQLEMTKLLYMDNEEIAYHPKRAKKVRNLLKATFKALIAELKK